MAKDKVTEFFNGIMDKNLREIGRMESNVVLEFGDPPKEIIMKVNGIITGSKVKVFLNIETVYTEELFKIF